MEIFLKLIFFTLLGISCIQANNHYSLDKQRKCRHYSRSSSRYRSLNCGAENDYSDGEVQNGGALKYGHTYRGLGKISTPEECARPCVSGASPRVCYYKFTVELYRTLGRACDLCHPTTNTSLSSDCECILADGYDIAGRMVVNRMYPGPSIQVCISDLVLVDVKNRVSGNGLAIHWHGIYQNGWQHYDGVPYITQCPIMFGTTFRYQWRAQNAGTHFYHAHTGLHQQDGLDGAIIIRVPPNEDPNSAHYDEDRYDTIMMMKDWMHTAAQDHWPGTTVRHVDQMPDNILVNGKGQWFNQKTGHFTDVPLAVYNVESNRRYRFRMINAFSWVCSVQVTVQDHYLTVIASDGEDVKPRRVTTLTSSAAERYDLVIRTDQVVGTYYIQYRLVGSACRVANLTQVAILRYIGSDMEWPKIERPSSFNLGLPLGIEFNKLNEVCSNESQDVVCVKDLQNTDAVDARIFAEEADVSILLFVKFYSFTPQQLFASHTYENFEAPSGSIHIASMISNISNVFPPSPFLTQYNDIPARMICDAKHKPKRCNTTELCTCSHLIRNIPLNSVVEVITLEPRDLGLNHPFHLHGYGFHVMAQGNLKDVNITEENKHKALRLHEERYGKLNPNPPVKDTLNLSSGGYTIVRFIADNPGYWLYHCHFRSHQLSGMEVAFQVGTPEDLPPTPPGFPKCGNFVPSPRKRLLL